MIRNANIDVKIVGIEVAAKNLAMQKERLPAGTLKDYAFNFMVDIKLVEKEKLAVANIYVEVKDESGAKLADLTTLCAFQFPDFDNIFTLQEGNRYDLPFELEVQLKDLSISATRGILYSELRGTYLHNVILPLIDIRSVIERDRQRIRAEQGK